MVRFALRPSLPLLPARGGKGGGGEASPTIPQPLPRPRPPQDGRTRRRKGPARPGARDGDPISPARPEPQPPDAKRALRCVAVRTAVRSGKPRPNPGRGQIPIPHSSRAVGRTHRQDDRPLTPLRWSVEARSPPRGALQRGTPSERTPDPLQAFAPTRAHDGMTDARRA